MRPPVQPTLRQPVAQPHQRALPQSTVLFVHLQYDAPHSPQSRALYALAATVARTTPRPLYLVGGYEYDDFDTDSLPLAVARAVRAAHQARTDAAMAGQLQAHLVALAAQHLPVAPLLWVGPPGTVLAQTARDLDAAVVLVGLTKEPQGFAMSLGGTYEALQAAVPCPVRYAVPAATSHTTPRQASRRPSRPLEKRRAA